jgi:flagellar protein FlbD
MIQLTRLNGEHIAINPDRIERADVTPDVVLTMTDGSKFVVAESLDELIDRIRLFRASVLALSLVFDADTDEGETHLHIVRGSTAPPIAERPRHVHEDGAKAVGLHSVVGDETAEAAQAAETDDVAAALLPPTYGTGGPSDPDLDPDPHAPRTGDTP